MFESIGQNMEYVVQAFKVLINLVHTKINVRAQKTGFFYAFLTQNTISLHDYQLNLCTLIPKGA